MSFYSALAHKDWLERLEMEALLKAHPRLSKTISVICPSLRPSNILTTSLHRSSKNVLSTF